MFGKEFKSQLLQYYEKHYVDIFAEWYGYGYVCVMTVKVYYTNNIKRSSKATPKSERLNWKHVSEIKRFTLRDLKINGETVHVKRNSNSNFLIP